MFRVCPAGRTPLTAAFFCLAGLLGGCQSAGILTELPPDACNGPVTPIASIQGDGTSSPVVGKQLQIRGVVTLTRPGSGLFLQEPLSDLSPLTSDGLFVDNAQLARLATAGDQIIASGTAAELGDENDSITTLTGITGYRVCASNIPLPVSDARLPLSADEKEALEGMNIILQQSLAVTGVYGLRDGLLRLSLNGILPAPTEVARPGADAREQAQKNWRSSMYVALHASDQQPYAVGATVMAATGVFGHDGRGLRLLLREPLAALPKPVYRTDPPAGSDTRVLGLNLNNYFNGDGLGGGFPTSRGAASRDEYTEQRDRVTALFSQVNPHIVGVVELENDGFGPRSAARDLIIDLQNAGNGKWDVVNPYDAPIGSDEITVGIFYRSDLLERTGEASVLSSRPFERLNRKPLAQWFVHRATGETFLIAVSHLKSKGSCPDDGPNVNRRDGQGCWNPARTAAAREVTAWVNRMMQETGEAKALILGDMNAYRMEDPITAIIKAGFKDLTASTGFQLEYSYVFHGQAGTLDYAFASPELVPIVRSARFLNFNSAYAPGMSLEYPWLRSSDHDPVLVDLRFRHPATAD
jgi:predicted extracellular nuclease